MCLKEIGPHSQNMISHPKLNSNIIGEDWYNLLMSMRVSTSTIYTYELQKSLMSYLNSNPLMKMQKRTATVVTIVMHSFSSQSTTLGKLFQPAN
jgi:hypothetical protein